MAFPEPQPGLVISYAYLLKPRPGTDGALPYGLIRPGCPRQTPQSTILVDLTAKEPESPRSINRTKFVELWRALGTSRPSNSKK